MVIGSWKQLRGRGMIKNPQHRESEKMNINLNRYLLLILTPLLVILFYMKWYDYLFGHHFPEKFMESTYWTLLYTLIFLIIDVAKVSKHIKNTVFLSIKRIFIYTGLVFMLVLILGNISTIFIMLLPIQENFVLHILFIYFVGFATAKLFLFTVFNFTKDE